MRVSQKNGIIVVVGKVLRSHYKIDRDGYMRAIYYVQTNNPNWTDPTGQKGSEVVNWTISAWDFAARLADPEYPYPKEHIAIEAEAISGLDRYQPDNEYTWAYPATNIWLGVSAENQAMANKRIPILRETHAALRIVSLEPLLGPIDLAEAGALQPAIDWVIAGGESGPNARPMHPAWPRALRDQCADARIPFYFKQQGEWAPIDLFLGEILGEEAKKIPIDPHRPDDLQDAAYMRRVGKKKAGHLLDGRASREYPH